jgi:hypothetical protein
MEVHSLVCDKDETKRWDAYVVNSSQAGHYHLSGWGRVIEKVMAMTLYT